MVHRVIDRLPIWPTAFFPLFLVIIRLISFSSMWRLKERLWKRRRHRAAKETNLTHTHTLAQQKGDICLETMIFREEDNEIEANMEKKSNGEKPAERQINKIKSNDVAHALCCFQSDTVASTVCRTWVKKLYDGMAEKEEKKKGEKAPVDGISAPNGRSWWVTERSSRPHPTPDLADRLSHMSRRLSKWIFTLIIRRRLVGPVGSCLHAIS